MDMGLFAHRHGLFCKYLVVHQDSYWRFGNSCGRHPCKWKRSSQRCGGPPVQLAQNEDEMDGEINIIQDVSPSVDGQGNGIYAVEYLRIAVVEEGHDCLRWQPGADEHHPDVHIDQHSIPKRQSDHSDETVVEHIIVAQLNDCSKDSVVTQVI